HIRGAGASHQGTEGDGRVRRPRAATGAGRQGVAGDKAPPGSAPGSAGQRRPSAADAAPNPGRRGARSNLRPRGAPLTRQAGRRTIHVARDRRSEGVGQPIGEAVMTVLGLLRTVQIYLLRCSPMFITSLWGSTTLPFPWISLIPAASASSKA